MPVRARLAAQALKGPPKGSPNPLRCAALHL